MIPARRLRPRVVNNMARVNVVENSVHGIAPHFFVLSTRLTPHLSLSSVPIVPFPSLPDAIQSSATLRLCFGATWPVATQPGARRTTLRRGTSSGEGGDSSHGEPSRIIISKVSKIPKSPKEWPKVPIVLAPRRRRCLLDVFLFLGAPHPTNVWHRLPPPRRPAEQLSRSAHARDSRLRAVRLGCRRADSEDHQGFPGEKGV